jgi:hypothetical protein
VSGVFNSATEAQKMIRVWTKVSKADKDSCQKLLAMSQSSNQGLAGCLGLAMAKHFLDGDMLGCK